MLGLIRVVFNLLIGKMTILILFALLFYSTFSNSFGSSFCLLFLYVIVNKSLRNFNESNLFFDHRFEFVQVVFLFFKGKLFDDGSRAKTVDLFREDRKKLIQLNRQRRFKIIVNQEDLL